MKRQLLCSADIEGVRLPLSSFDEPCFRISTSSGLFHMVALHLPADILLKRSLMALLGLVVPISCRDGSADLGTLIRHSCIYLACNEPHQQRPRVCKP